MYSSSCDPPDEVDQALQFQKIDVLAWTNGSKTSWPNEFQSKWCSGCTPIVHAARSLFANPIKTDVFSFLLGPNRTRRAASCVMGASTRFRSQVRLQQRSKNCDKKKLVKQSPVHSTSSAWRQSAGCSAYTSILAKTSRRKVRANAHPPRRRCRSVRQHRDETRGSRGNLRVPEMPSRRPLQNSPGSVLPDLHVRKPQNTENDKVVNVHVSTLVRGKGESSDQQGSFVQCARSEQLSAVST